MQDAVTIGRLFELHRWRREGHDADAMRGAKSVASGEEGAAATAALTKERTQPRLERMKQLVPKHGVENAARILATKGMGTLVANKALWYRRRKK